MNELPETLTIGVLAEAAGVNVETIRFYQRKGLMQEPDRPLGGIRRYGETDRGRVRFIKSAQRLGFSLDEIGDLLKLEDGSHCTEAREQAEHKLADVRARLADLHEPALGGGHVEHRPQLAVAARFLVVGGDAVPHELTEHEDGRLHVEGHRVVLERGTVPVAHQVVDQPTVAIGCFNPRCRVAEGLLTQG